MSTPSYQYYAGGQWLVAEGNALFRHGMAAEPRVSSGIDDPLVPLINGRILAALIPRARLEVVDDGHLFLLTHPLHIAAEIRHFLAAAA